jgi:outer membrane protein OmpA-like peptidoglycan-associated protein
MRGFVLSVVACGFGLLAISSSQATPAARDNVRNTREFVVFFENNKATLTPEGREIVRAAAERARRSHAAMITVSAPTTRVVSGYDPSLAQPRLAMVQAQLIAYGVSRDQVAQGTVRNDVHVPLVGAERVEIRVLPNPVQNS